jgi:hypothetical protein
LQHEQTFGVNRFTERLFAGHASTIKVGCDIDAGRTPGVVRQPSIEQVFASAPRAS